MTECPYCGEYWPNYVTVNRCPKCNAPADGMVTVCGCCGEIKTCYDECYKWIGESRLVCEECHTKYRVVTMMNLPPCDRGFGCKAGKKVPIEEKKPRIVSLKGHAKVKGMHPDKIIVDEKVIK